VSAVWRSAIGGLVIVESGDTLEHLLAKYAKGSSLNPLEGSPDFARYLQFMHYAEGTAMAHRMMDWMSRSPEKRSSRFSISKLPGCCRV
jgi:glutathione S-transferase